ncbi:MAG: hypothetical protein HC825_08270 [Oscillatoriales cyanobacterium RM1_1_9]|nr:hypothetical protein [Oscillatoriales cyanobacterium SM2_3_0]NJO44851.1 hypothetical protein [Oscillatoriales cyanobacterium RM2_1_1]NJO71677.1 hypothetical protein [Oscillatoriales cyanobacterium RM1_1_9]
MTPILLRKIWSLVEATQAPTIATLDDAALVQWLLKRLEADAQINSKEAAVMNDYISSKVSLIRDLAESRLIGEP